MPLVCHFCGEVGHNAGNYAPKSQHNFQMNLNVLYSFFFLAQCPKIPSESKDIYRTPADVNATQAQRDRTNLRPLDEVTCYRVRKFPYR